MHVIVRRRRIFPCLVLVLGIGASSAASANELLTAPTPVQPIVGGDLTEECEWPTTVYMAGCTGTLVHPEVVVFAAHCMLFAGGQGPQTADFGALGQQPVRSAPIDRCMMFPGWSPDPSGFGNDIAFCVLDEPVLDVPIVPVLMGCETDVLTPGQGVTLVGYGVAEGNQGGGIKRKVDVAVNGFEGDEISVGGGGFGSCNGDSGGPAYVQLEDGTWRVFGVTSRGTSGVCTQANSIYGLIHNHTEWIESETGIDITPCHDSDGTWNPTEACTEFPLTPNLGSTTWAEGCAQPRLSGPSMTCGEAFDGGERGSTGEGPEGTGGSDSSTTDADSSTFGAGTAGDTSSGDAADGNDAETSTGNGTQTDGSETAGQDGDGGCGCRASTDQHPTVVAALFLACGGFLRRRTRRS